MGRREERTLLNWDVESEQCLVTECVKPFSKTKAACCRKVAELNSWGHPKMINWLLVLESSVMKRGSLYSLSLDNATKIFCQLSDSGVVDLVT
jgi:hypothetical protein